MERRAQLPCLTCWFSPPTKNMATTSERMRRYRGFTLSFTDTEIKRALRTLFQIRPLVLLKN